ncbi:hypothetical protein O6H91_10G030900 [Diphasiastrum complanatum]|uniref:Uncharacterized protein n=1 Tax=Diphasiastrum complanatum TaxID=34168 RepID=A0ACC2CFU7_DIPCM|nr:hypothetical protein O6H91_10G030900 [Diphasiastrum complanatum]
MSKKRPCMNEINLRGVKLNCTIGSKNLKDSKTNYRLFGISSWIQDDRHYRRIRSYILDCLLNEQEWTYQQEVEEHFSGDFGKRRVVDDSKRHYMELIRDYGHVMSCFNFVLIVKMNGMMMKTRMLMNPT